MKKAEGGRESDPALGRTEDRFFDVFHRGDRMHQGSVAAGLPPKAEMSSALAMKSSVSQHYDVFAPGGWPRLLWLHQYQSRANTISGLFGG
jgi:hypothetical protein